jgi:hypothetical protein
MADLKIGVPKSKVFESKDIKTAIKPKIKWFKIGV